MLVALITGSRDWTDGRQIAQALRGAEALIVGDAKGADALALQIALAWDIIPYVYCASAQRAARLRQTGGVNVYEVCDWRVIGKRAGHVRNAAMVRRALAEQDAGMQVYCAAFPLVRSVGTWNCVAQLRQAGFAPQIFPAA